MQKPSSHHWDWLSVILFVFMLQAAAARLVVTHWTDFLIFAESLATIGAFLGLALGYSQFQKRVVVWLGIAYSLVLIPWQMTFAIQGETLLEKLISLSGRLSVSLHQLVRNEPVEDGLLFVVFISTVLWLIGMISGYWLTRHDNYLAGVLPGEIFLLIIQHYDPFFPSRIWLQGAYLLLALMLLGRFYYLRNQESWRERRIFQVQESTFDLTRGMVVAATLFVIVAWSLPSTLPSLQSAVKTWDRFTKPFETLQERWANAVRALQSPTRIGENDFYSNQLSLGQGNPLEDTVVFTVQPPDLPEIPPRYYWRGYVYDVYFNNKWYTRTIRTDDFNPGSGNIPIPDIENRTEGIFVFAPTISQSLLYTPPQPEWMSRTGVVKTFILDSGEQDLSAFFAEPPVVAGEQYKIRSQLADPSIQDLEAAGEDYPEWVTDRYLQLPDNFSPRITDLAAQIAENQNTPYDKTVAVTNYLRNNIEYTNPLPEAPPKGVDVLEWVLFDIKKGFCNYYASAEVVMLRSLGIPARMAVGFSQGEYNQEGNYYTVRYYDAHAWPEVYFPGIGWVEFEPTGNQDPLIRPNRPLNSESITPPTRENFLNLEELDQNRNLPDKGLDLQTQQETPSRLLIYALYIGAAALMIALLIFANRRFAVMERLPARLQTAFEHSGGQAPTWINNWARWNELSPTQRSFEAINRSLRLLGNTPAVHYTPVERANALIKLLPKATDAIQALLAEHQASTFTRDQGNVNVARQASFTISLYTLQSLLLRIYRRFFRRYSTVE